MEEIALHEFTKYAMKRYILETVEDRAIPEFKDGLKPVQRKILWTMHKLGLRYDLAYKKSARVEGSVMGLFHPHGSCYSSMVALAQPNKKYFLLDGQGNWGSYSGDPAAASRYSECKPSKLSDVCLLDKDYLKVVPYMLNYDGTEKEPVYLPARLPFILLNRSVGIATAVSAFLPCFKLGSLIDVCISYLKDNSIDLTELKWEFAGVYGGKCISSEEKIREVLEKGRGGIDFEPNYQICKNEIIITGLQDDFNVEKVAASLKEMTEVKSFRDESAESQIRLVIKLNCKPTDKAAMDKIFKVLRTRDNYQINILHRIYNKEQDEVETYYNETNVVKVLKNWCKFRVKLEKDYLSYLMEEKNKDLAYQELLLSAADNLDIIFKALRNKEPSKILIKELKWTEEQCNIVLDLPVKRLSKLNSEKTKELIQNIKKDLKVLKNKYINIIDTVVEDLLYLKKEFSE